MPGQDAPLPRERRQGWRLISQSARRPGEAAETQGSKDGQCVRLPMSSAAQAHSGIFDAGRAGRQSLDGFVGFRGQPLRCLHHRQQRHRLGRGLTGYVSGRIANERPHGENESKNHDGRFHFEAPVSHPPS